MTGVEGIAVGLLLGRSDEKLHIYSLSGRVDVGLPPCRLFGFRSDLKRDQSRKTG